MMASHEQNLVLTKDHEQLLPSEFLVRDSTTQGAIRRLLARAYKLRKLNGFPGPHPTTLARSDLARLSTENCCVGLKADGVRYLLLCCVIDKQYKAFCIDRRLRAFEVVIWANPDYFDMGTVLDGELVFNHQTRSRCYQVFDVVALRGKCFHDEPYCNRLQAIHNHILCALPYGIAEHTDTAEAFIIDENKLYTPSGRNSISMQPKAFVRFKNVAALWQRRHEFSYMNDGLVFTLDHSPIRPGTAWSMLKWKPNDAIDLLVDDQFRVFCRESGIVVPFEKVRVGQEGYFDVRVTPNRLMQCIIHRYGAYNDDTTNHGRAAAADTQEENAGDAGVQIDGGSVAGGEHQHQKWLLECYIRIDYESQQVAFYPMRERLDKHEANDMKVIESTISNLRDSVALDEITATASSHPTGKRRKSNCCTDEAKPGHGKDTRRQPCIPDETDESGEPTNNAPLAEATKTLRPKQSTRTRSQGRHASRTGP